MIHASPIDVMLQDAATVLFILSQKLNLQSKDMDKMTPVELIEQVDQLFALTKTLDIL